MKNTVRSPHISDYAFAFLFTHDGDAIERSDIVGLCSLTKKQKMTLLSALHETADSLAELLTTETEVVDS